MDNQRPQEKPLRFSAIGRKPIAVTRESLVRISHLDDREGLPLVIEPRAGNINPADWAETEREMIEKQLLKYGAILFRNFDLESADQFEKFATTISPDLILYRERSSPRSEIKKGIYTSTDYPSDQSIHFHNEQSYARSWPMKLWFFCMRPAQQGGATPIADGRIVYQRIDSAIRERFLEKKVMYMRNYGDGLGLTWQTAFQTSSKADVEEYCRNANISFEWKSEDRLRTRQIFKTIVNHPVTGEPVWFEHTAFFHISSLQPHVRETLIAEFGEDELPFNTYYGDGTPIEESVLDQIREAYEQEAVRFQWQKKDLLLIDNVLVSHARDSYSGERKILVAMTDLYCVS
jgi:alpha-ketoglutarate-dependent taurine dioxygenase